MWLAYCSVAGAEAMGLITFYKQAHAHTNTRTHAHTRTHADMHTCGHPRTSAAFLAPVIDWIGLRRS